MAPIYLVSVTSKSLFIYACVMKKCWQNYGLANKKFFTFYFFNKLFHYLNISKVN